MRKIVQFLSNLSLKGLFVKKDKEDRLLHLLEEILRVSTEILHETRQINKKLDRRDQVSHFIIKQVGVISMATQGPLTGIVPGATGTFVANPQDSNGNPAALPSGIVPAWTVSDPTIATATPSADGLSVNVAVSSTATVGSTFTLSVQATLADGTIPSGSAPVPINAAPPAVVASFVITQTA